MIWWPIHSPPEGWKVHLLDICHKLLIHDYCVLRNILGAEGLWSSLRDTLALKELQSNPPIQESVWIIHYAQHILPGYEMKMWAVSLSDHNTVRLVMFKTQRNVLWDKWHRGMLKLFRGKEYLAILQACYVFHAQCQTHLLFCFFSYPQFCSFIVFFK